VLGVQVETFVTPPFQWLKVFHRGFGYFSWVLYNEKDAREREIVLRPQ